MFRCWIFAYPFRWKICNIEGSFFPHDPMLSAIQFLKCIDAKLCITSLINTFMVMFIYGKEKYSYDMVWLVFYFSSLVLNANKIIIHHGIAWDKELS